MERDDLRDAVHDLWKRHGRVGAVPVVGESMRPLLAARDEVVVRYGIEEPPRVGGIVAFERDGRTVVHRVVARRRRNGRIELLERGDSAGAGTWIALDAVLGRVLGRPSSAGEVVPLESGLAARRRALRSLAVHVALRAAAALAGRPVSLRFRRPAGPTAAASATLRRGIDGGIAWAVRAALLPETAEPPPELDPESADALVRIAERHRVAPLLWHALTVNGAAGALPPRSAERLRSVYYANAARGARVLAELARIGSALDAFDVPWLSLKGAPMAARLWGNVALRPTDDVDLLVRQSDVDRAVALLGELGYAVRDPRATARRRAWHHQVILDQPGATPSCLELHWALADRFSLALPEVEGIWSRARDHQLDPLDEAVYLAAHLDKHGWFNRLVTPADDPADVRRFVLDARSENRLLWFADLARSLDRPEAPLDAEAFADSARAWHVHEPVARALVVLDRLAEEALPARFRPLLPRRRRGVFANRAWRRWTAGADRTSSPDGAPAKKSWLVARGARTGFRPLRLLDGLRYLWPPRRYLRLRYPERTHGATARLAHVAAIAGELRAIVSGFVARAGS